MTMWSHIKTMLWSFCYFIPQSAGAKLRNNYIGYDKGGNT